MTKELFIASYSGGKDSVLAVYQAIQSGLAPLALVNTFNTDKKRSWFHGIPKSVLDRVAESTGIPVHLMQTSGETYAANFEACLKSYAEQGARYCVFGDIDLEAHRVWCTARCENAGLLPLFPLWNKPRASVVHAFLEAGFRAVITIVDQSRLSEAVLGQTLSQEVLDIIAKEGADVCGENGEYHSFVYDGPLFKTPIDFTFGDKIIEKNYAILPIET